MKIAHKLNMMREIINTPFRRWVTLWTLLLAASFTTLYMGGPTALQHQAQLSGGHNLAARIDQIVQAENQGISRPVQRRITQRILTLSRAYQIDPFLVLAVIKVESSFRPEVVSYAGAIGLMQIKPIVVREVADELVLAVRSPEALLRDPLSNLQVGIHYLSYLRERFGANNWYHVLAAYNMGPTKVGRIVRRQRQPSKRYYAKVMRAYRAYSRPTPTKAI